MLGDQALEKLLRDYEFETVLDIGSGKGEQAEVMRAAGKRVTTLDRDPIVDADICLTVGDDHLDLTGFPDDVIWCCHALEHCRNVEKFLDDIWQFWCSNHTYSFDDHPGILAITVPPFRQVVPGHVTAWNAGLLLYNLVLAGFDCSNAAVKTYGYNISVIVERSPHTEATAHQPLTELAHFFPVPLTGERPKLGVLPTDIDEVNW